MTIIFLGTGTSDGVPTIGCNCGVCRSEDTRDKRLRSSVWIRGNDGSSVLIDTGPEFRIQALREHISKIDAILITHSHADHVHGLDDVRPLTFASPIPIFANAETIEDLRERFAYIFRETQRGGGKPRIELRSVSDSFKIGKIDITPIPIKHGKLDIYGWKITESGKSIVYITDAKQIPRESETLIGKPDILIINALRKENHPTHFTFDEALEAALKTGAKQVYFTHIAHNFSHEEIKTYCGNSLKEKNITQMNVEPAFDGLSLTI